MIYEKILAALEKNDIRYLVIGGLAVWLHGYDRATKDLDLMVSFEKDNMDKFIKIVKSLGLKPRVPVEPDELADKNKREFWKNEKNMKVFSFYNPENDTEIIDIMIQDYIDFEEAYKSKNLVEFRGLGIKIKVISIDNLIKLKEIAGRSTDKIDIEKLRKVQEIKNEKQ